jgi:hypothetical protein
MINTEQDFTDAREQLRKAKEIVARDISLTICRRLKPGATDGALERLQLAIEEFLE